MGDFCATPSKVAPAAVVSGTACPTGQESGALWENQWPASKAGLVQNVTTSRDRQGALQVNHRSLTVAARVYLRCPPLLPHHLGQLDESALLLERASGGVDDGGHFEDLRVGDRLLASLHHFPERGRHAEHLVVVAVPEIAFDGR